MIRLLGSKIRNPNKLEPIKGIKEIIKISDKLKLPYWWVESVIIEYFPCRQFVEAGSGELSSFNFKFFTDSLIDSIKEYQVIMPGGSILMQNISAEDFAFRSPGVMVGEYVEPLDQANLIPEGLANSNAWLFQANSLLSVDPKVGFNQYAIVFDNDLFYQYKIAELYEISSHHSWFKSELFDLIPLWILMNQISDCQNQFNKMGKFMIESNLKEKVVHLYDSLEQIRKPIREKILKYHNDKKGSHDNAKIVSAEPPLLTINESIKPVGDGFEVISYLEPLFFRSAYSNYLMARKAKNDQKRHNLRHDALQDEIEYSAVSIICSVTCLESYINGIIRRHLPNNLEMLDMSHEKKWLNVLGKLNPKIILKKEDEPFKSLIRLIGLRDKAVHYKPQYRKAVSDKNHKPNISYTYFNYNYQNAKFGVDVIHKMISLLTKRCNMPMPKWLSTEKKSVISRVTRDSKKFRDQ